MQVPTGGILKCIKMFPSTGEGMELTPESELMNGAYCPVVKTDRMRKKPIAERRMAGGRGGRMIEGGRRAP